MIELGAGRDIPFCSIVPAGSTRLGGGVKSSVVICSSAIKGIEPSRSRIRESETSATSHEASLPLCRARTCLYVCSPVANRTEEH
jgi:hypothetical protein